MDALLAYLKEVILENKVTGSAVAAAVSVLGAVLGLDLVGNDGDKAVFWVLLGLGVIGIIAAVLAENNMGETFAKDNEAKPKKDIYNPPKLRFVKIIRNCLAYVVSLLLVAINKTVYDKNDDAKKATTWLGVGVIIFGILKAMLEGVAHSTKLDGLGSLSKCCLGIWFGSEWDDERKRELKRINDAEEQKKKTTEEQKKKADEGAAAENLKHVLQQVVVPSIDHYMHKRGERFASL